MLTKGFLKPELKIQKIGILKFWIGIVVGILMAFTFSYFLIYSRISLALIATFQSQFILLFKEFRYYDLFCGSMGCSIGFGFTIIIWLSGTRNIHIKKRYWQILCVSNAWLVNFVAIMSISRMATIIPILGLNPLNTVAKLHILRDFWIILLLLPILVFFSHWNIVRLMFRTRNWVLISVVIYLIFVFVITYFTTPDYLVLHTWK